MGRKFTAKVRGLTFATDPPADEHYLQAAELMMAAGQPITEQMAQDAAFTVWCWHCVTPQIDPRRHRRLATALFLRTMAAAVCADAPGPVTVQ